MMDAGNTADIQVDIHLCFGQGGAKLFWGTEKLVWDNASNHW